MFLWAVVDPVLVYHSLNPVFLTTGQFFREHLSYPGGLAEYVGAFLLQSHAAGWLGAITLTVLALLTAGCVNLLVRAAGGGEPNGVEWVPAALLIASQGGYAVDTLARVVGIEMALVCAVVYAQLPAGGRWRIPGLVLLGAAVYYAAAGALYVFAACCAVLECRTGGIWRAGSAFGLAALLPFLAAELVFIVKATDAYGFLVPFVGDPPMPILLSLFYFSAPVVLAGARLNGWLRGRYPRALEDPKAVRHKPARAPRQRGGLGRWLKAGPWRRLGQPEVGMAASLAILAFGYDGVGKQLARVNHAADTRNWGSVLQWGQALAAPTPATVSDINRALAHQESLLESMFDYPQHRGWSLWFDMSRTVELTRLMKASDLLFELGHVNRSERMAGEALELNGRQAAVLRRLFQVSVLKGEPRSGEPFLNLLAKTPWHREEAEELRRQWEQDPTLSEEPTLKAVRALMVDGDYVGSIPINVLMQISLRRRPDNRMALEYLVAHYLLENQLDKVIQNLDRMARQGWNHLPRHVQEAILLARRLHPEADLDLRGFRLEPATVERFAEFNAAAARCNPNEAPRRLTAEYGGTYWYYYLVGRSGAFPENLTLPIE